MRMATVSDDYVSLQRKSSYLTVLPIQESTRVNELTQVHAFNEMSVQAEWAVVNKVPHEAPKFRQFRTTAKHSDDHLSFKACWVCNRS
jgi:hypothetical protein